MDTNPYESADATTLAEIIRQAESRLAGQLQAAIAADQRALTFSGLLVASIAALAAVVGTAKDPPLPAVLVATLLGLGAAAALWSARPTRWWFAGTEPFQWLPDLTDPAKRLHASMAEMAAHYDAALHCNSRSMRRAAWAMRISLGLTALSLLVVITWAWVKTLS